MDKKTLSRLEALNQIKLDDTQKEDVLAFFAKREEDVRKLNEIETEQVEAMVHVSPIAVRLREDEIKQEFSRESLQAQAPQTDAGYFCVPRVID
jgi:aspartyl/glutamyl-tRNA(Asn/Gln) amidotransferase C subunit